MPQTLTPEWIEELGEDARQHHARLLHTLGKLTLTGYNPDLSNRLYQEKRTLLGQSHFELNRHFVQVERWTPAAINERARSLAERALTIWPDVGRAGPSQSDPVIGTRKPVAVRFRGEIYPITTWKNAIVQLIERFEAAQPGALASLVSRGELPSELSSDPERFARSETNIGGIFVNTHASAHELKRRLTKIADRMGIPKTDYVFVFADDPVMTDGR